MQIKIADDKDKKLVFNLRLEVFVIEQNVPIEIELDADDENAMHIIAKENEIAVGCARVLFENNKAHIGRLAVKKEYRCREIGSGICKFIIEYCRDNKINIIWLNSQLHAVEFYKKLGFKPEGEIFIEAGIEHIKMQIN